MGRVKVQKMPTIRRLPTYLYRLNEMRKEGTSIVATPELARYMDIGEIVVRKDLSITGVTGQPGVGYKIDELIAAIREFLGWNVETKAVLVGAGSLGSALIGYDGFEEYGLSIIAAFDRDPAKAGTVMRGRPVIDMVELEGFVRNHKISMGILCVPAAVAQDICDIMVKSGIRSIWNFANVALKVPADVIVQREVIAGGLALLSVKRLRHFAETDDEEE
ncbi:MAG: redox-sensing transcriptional repressor Rex [Victivallaceae bacterium]|nr:redox-sensing transcriptional repressor Rex [Victivallaceae bacterium]